jgi:hypothetical protein
MPSLYDRNQASDERLREEQKAGDERLREEQKAGDERLREEQKAGDERLREEQKASGRLHFLPFDGAASNPFLARLPGRVLSENLFITAHRRADCGRISPEPVPKALWGER